MTVYIFVIGCHKLTKANFSLGKWQVLLVNIRSLWWLNAGGSECTYLWMLLLGCASQWKQVHILQFCQEQRNTVLHIVCSSWWSLSPFLWPQSHRLTPWVIWQCCYIRNNTVAELDDIFFHEMEAFIDQYGLDPNC